jgi:hypothetical protein
MKKESQQKGFLLRMNADMMEAVEKWADDEFRSVNGQILWILEQALKKSGRLKNKTN